VVVMSILRAYKAAVTKLPNDRAETRARLLAALDGVAVSTGWLSRWSGG
jgi:hypothetical protein